MAGSEPPFDLLLVGGDGHPSGVPRHIWHLASVLSGPARITVASDVSHGGYDGLEDVGVTHVTVPGLQSRLSLPHLLRGWRGLRRLLRHSEAEIIWLHARLPVVFGRLMLALRLWRPAPGTTVVVTYHGLPFGAGHPPRRAAISLALERGLLRACPRLELVFLTRDQADRMTRAMGAACMARHGVHVLPNSSDLGPLPPTGKAPGQHLVMTGRCGYQKNYPLALRLFAHLPQSTTLTLCGAGTDSAEFQAEAAQILPPEALARVRFAGPVRDVRPVLAAADGYLLCSRYEGLPIGALEAFEAGLPLILSRFEGAEELAAPHPLALCLEFDDLAQDAARITALLEEARNGGEELAGRIRAAWAERWSYEAFRSAVLELIGRLRG